MCPGSSVIVIRSFSLSVSARSVIAGVRRSEGARFGWYGFSAFAGEANRPPFGAATAAAADADFTIVVPLFGHSRYFARRHELVRYRDNVLVALEVSAAPRLSGPLRVRVPPRPSTRRARSRRLTASELPVAAAHHRHA